jgi:hypothetical protein
MKVVKIISFFKIIESHFDDWKINAFNYKVTWVRCVDQTHLSNLKIS